MTTSSDTAILLQRIDALTAAVCQLAQAHGARLKNQNWPHGLGFIATPWPTTWLAKTSPRLGRMESGRWQM